MKIEHGRIVTMHYTLKDASGATIESSREGAPLAYLHGYGQLIPGLERELAGTEPGHVATVTVAPEDAYGSRDPRAVIRADKGSFPEDITIEPGAEVAAETPEGPLSFVIVAVEGDQVVLDANHPMAGKTLTFDVEVVGVREATPDELSHGHAHGPDGHEH